LMECMKSNRSLYILHGRWEANDSGQTSLFLVSCEPRNGKARQAA